MQSWNKILGEISWDTSNHSSIPRDINLQKSNIINQNKTRCLARAQIEIDGKNYFVERTSCQRFLSQETLPKKTCG